MSSGVVSCMMVGVMFWSGTDTTQATKTRNKTYANENYLFSVDLPSDVQIETAAPPNPNHGFAIRFDPQTSLWVDGSYTDDASLKDAVTSQSAVLEPGCRQLRNVPAVLGHLRAAKLSFHCDGSSANERPHMLTIVLGLRSHAPERGRIVYQVGMRSPLDGEAHRRAEEVFGVIVRGFALLPR